MKFLVIYLLSQNCCIVILSRAKYRDSIISQGPWWYRALLIMWAVFWIQRTFQIIFPPRCHKLCVHTSKWCTCLLRVTPGKWCPIIGGQSRHIVLTWRCPLVIGSHVTHVTGMNMFIVTTSSDWNCRNMSGFWIDATNADVPYCASV